MLKIDFILFLFELILWSIVFVAISHEKDLITFERKIYAAIKSIFKKAE